ncbi:unnamed protein product [Tenebrio molitor]|nr:unnamed protein product [Tenebrio molitor]
MKIPTRWWNHPSDFFFLESCHTILKRICVYILTAELLFRHKDL